MRPLMILLARAPAPPVDVDPSTGKGPEWGKAAPIGLLVILLLCIAVFFLLRSMTRRIDRVSGEFAARENAAAVLAGDGSDGPPISGPSGTDSSEVTDSSAVTDSRPTIDSTAVAAGGPDSEPGS